MSSKPRSNKCLIVKVVATYAAALGILWGLMIWANTLEGVERQTAWQILSNVTGGFYNLTSGYVLGKSSQKK